MPGSIVRTVLFLRYLFCLLPCYAFYSFYVIVITLLCTCFISIDLCSVSRYHPNELLVTGTGFLKLYLRTVFLKLYLRTGFLKLYLLTGFLKLYLLCVNSGCASWRVRGYAGLPTTRSDSGRASVRTHIQAGSGNRLR